MITLTREEFQQRYKNQKPVEVNKNITLSKEDFNQKYNINNNKGFLSGVKSDIGQRAEEMGEIADRYSSGKQGLGSSIFQAGSKGISGLWDITGRGLSAITPDSIEEPIKKVVGETIGKIAETEPVQDIVGRYSEFAKNNPTKAENLKAFGEYLSVLPVGKAAGVSKSLTTKGALKATQGIRKGVAKTSRATKTLKDKIGKKAYNKLDSVSRDLMKMSPTQTRNEIKWNKNTPKFLVDEGIIDKIESDGKRIVTEKAKTALKEKYHAESIMFNKLLTDSGEYVSLNNFKTKAINSVSDEFKVKGTDHKKAIDQIKNEVEAYKDNYRKTGLIDNDDVLVNISDFSRIKTGLWSKTSNFNPTQSDKLLSDVSYRMGQTAKTLIEDTVEDVAVKRMNARLGDFASAIKVLDNANGKVLPGGFFGKAFTKFAGTITGSSAGIPGSIIGNLTGGILADIMMNPSVKTGALTKALKLLGKKQNGRSLIDEANAILLKRGKEREARKLLEASKTIFASPKKDTSRLRSQKEATKNLEELGVIKDVSQDLSTATKKKNTGIIDDMNNNLTEQAKKFDSVEEFVKSQGEPVYHGTNAKFEVFDKAFQVKGSGELGFYFNPKEVSKTAYKRQIKAYINMKKPFIASPDNRLSVKYPELKPLLKDDSKFDIKAQEILKKEGYDGVIFKDEKGISQYVVFEPSQIKTKQQLTEIYNKAKKN